MKGECSFVVIVMLLLNESINLIYQPIDQLFNTNHFKIDPSTDKKKQGKMILGTHLKPLRDTCEHECKFYITVLRTALLTCLQAESLSGFNLYWSKWDVVYLQASYSSTEITLVSNTGSHPRWIVRSQSYPADSLPSNFPVIDIQSGNTRTLIIGSRDKIPSLWFNKVRLHWRCKFSCTRHETYQQHSSTDHPQVNAKAVRLVIEDGTNRSIRIYPSQDRNGIPGV